MDSLDIRLKITHLRKARGMSQAQLARSSGLSNAAVCEIESGKKFPTSISLQKIASAFGMDIAELLTYSPDSSISITVEHLGIEENKELLEWIKNPESLPYIKYAYRLSQKISADMLDDLKFSLDIKL